MSYYSNSGMTCVNPDSKNHSSKWSSGDASKVSGIGGCYSTPRSTTSAGPAVDRNSLLSSIPW